MFSERAPDFVKKCQHVWFKVSQFMAILLIEKQIQLHNLQTQETKVWSKLADLAII